MSKSIVVGTTLAVLGLGGMALGAWQVQERGPEYAQIVAVEPVTRTVETPREVCEDVVSQAPSSQGAPSRDPHRVVGTAAGAIVGGLLGNQIGGGSGKKIATLAGAVGGGFAGREIQGRVEANQRAQAAQPQTITRRECRTVVDTHQETEGYEVTWRHDEITRTSRLEFAPQGERVRLEQGEPRWEAVLTEES